MKVEICCADYPSLCAAVNGGATRVELCSGISDGGLTPAPELIRRAVDMGVAEVNVLVRLRPGDFCYTEEEVSFMEAEIAGCIASGATGIVCGALRHDGSVDIEAVTRFRSAAASAGFTFHRAFDLCRDPFSALEDIIALGCTSLLTSGLAADAYSGKEMLGQIRKAAGGRIEVMAGAGVKPSNVRGIIECSGVDAVHSTASVMVESAMTFRRGDVNMGTLGVDEYMRKTTSSEVVAALIAAVSY